MTTGTDLAERPASSAPAKPIDTVRAALERMKPQIAMALPRHLTPDRLLRVAVTAIQNTPKLLECDRTSLYSAIMTCAQLGLEPDGVLGQAYLIPFGDKVQFIPGYKGLISLARNSGEVLSIQAHEVRQRDKFVFRFGLNEELDHVPADGDRGEITHFWAMARFKDGGNHWDVMTRAEVEAIRDGSQGYRTAKRYPKNGVIVSPWEQHFVEMGKKTVIRRIAKYLPMSVQKAAAIADGYDSGRHGYIDTHGEVVVAAAQVEGDAQAQVEGPKATKLDQFEAANGGNGPDDPPPAASAMQPPGPPPADAVAQGDAPDYRVAVEIVGAGKAATINGQKFQAAIFAMLDDNLADAGAIFDANAAALDRLMKEDPGRRQTIGDRFMAVAEGTYPARGEAA